MSHLCNRCVRELLILARTWFAFGLPSKPGVTTTHLVYLALITSHLENKNGRRRKHDGKHQAIRATNNTQITLSLKSLITNDHLSQLWDLERLEALIVSLNGLLALVLNVKDWSA
jgi:hypothetical protein